MSLLIGSIEIPLECGFEGKQSYSWIGGKTLLRMKNGSGVMQSRWRKLKSSVSGNGWLPAALDGVNDVTPVAVSCIGRMSAYGSSTSITLPYVYRTDGDYAPQAAAVVNGEIVPTTVSMAAQVATLGTVSGASQYQVVFYPVITGFVTITHADDEGNGGTNWTIEIEQQ